MPQHEGLIVLILYSHHHTVLLGLSKRARKQDPKLYPQLHKGDGEEQELSNTVHICCVYFAQHISII